MGIQDTDVGIIAFDFEPITVSTTAVELTATKYASAVRATITIETAKVRVRFDGTSPTSSVGHVVDTNSVINLEGTKQISLFKVIREGDTDATLSASYFH